MITIALGKSATLMDFGEFPESGVAMVFGLFPMKIQFHGKLTQFWVSGFLFINFGTRNCILKANLTRIRSSTFVFFFQFWHSFARIYSLSAVQASTSPMIMPV